MIGTGGTLLVVVAALLAFWPRRGRTGFPAIAVLALVTLYVVPAVVLDFEGEFLRGAALALLLLAFLRLEKLRVRDAPAAGVVARRRRDPRARRRAGARRARPVVGLRELGARDGRHQDRELQLGPRLQPARLAARRARAAAREGALPRPTGRRPTSTCSTGARGAATRASAASEPASSCRSAARRSPAGPSGSRSRCATCRRKRSSAPASPPRSWARTGYPIGGGVFSSTRGLGRGDSYAADVYSPLPTDRQLRVTGTDYADWLRSYISVLLPDRRPDIGDDAANRQVPMRVTFPFWGSGAEPEAERFGEFLGPAEPGARAVRARAHVGARAGAARGGRDAVRVRRARRGLPRRRLRLLRGAAAGRGDARRLPVRRADRLLPAVLRRRGAPAAHGRDPRARRDRVHVRLVRRQAAGVRRARPRRALVGRGLVPRLRLGHPRPDAGERAAAGPAQRERARRRWPALGSAGPRRRAAQRPRERPRARPGGGHQLGHDRARRAPRRWSP